MAANLGVMKKNYLVSLIAIIVILFFGYLIFSGGAKDGSSLVGGENETVGPWKFDTFAQCLSEKGMFMYGSATCSTCAKQRKLFGDSFQYVREVECHPRYPHAETERCVVKEITHTPTWIMEDANGAEIKRMDPGYQNFATLSEFSGCPFVEDVI